VRIGEDLPVHRVARADELAAQRAAWRAGLAPEIVHAETGAMVMRHVDGRTLAADDLREGGMLERVAALLRRCHAEVARQLERPPARFWPFDVFRHYDRLVRVAGGRAAGELDDLATLARRLEATVGPAEGLAFCHNDLLPANLIDDGARLWLLDWEYAGLNLPLFDLANLATNAELDEAAERALLAAYFGGEARSPDRRAWEAMRCASLLREVLWSMAAETSSTLDVDYRAYTAENLRRLASARARLDG
jgi:thiamine kinase-like enzyme